MACLRREINLYGQKDIPIQSDSSSGYRSRMLTMRPLDKFNHYTFGLLMHILEPQAIAHDHKQSTTMMTGEGCSWC